MLEDFEVGGKNEMGFLPNPSFLNRSTQTKKDPYVTFPMWLAKL